MALGVLTQTVRSWQRLVAYCLKDWTPWPRDSPQASRPWLSLMVKEAENLTLEYMIHVKVLHSVLAYSQGLEPNGFHITSPPMPGTIV